MTNEQERPDINNVILGGTQFPDLDKYVDRYQADPTLPNLIRVAHTALEAGVVNLAKSVSDTTTVGDNLATLLFNRIKQVRDLSVDMVRRQGSGASETTAGILAAMQEGCDVETVVGNILITSLLEAHHTMEVFVDDPHLADFSKEERVQLYKFLIHKEKDISLNKDAEHLLSEGEIYDHDASLRQYKYIVANEVDKLIRGKLGVFVGVTNIFGIRLDAFGDETKLKPKEIKKLVKLEDLFQMHLNSLKNLNRYINHFKTEKTEKIGQYMLESSANRYIGVEAEIEFGGHATYENTERGLDRALTIREYSIMIELTAGGLAFSMASQKEHIADYLNDEEGFETFKAANRLATRLIGLSNDCGAYLLRSNPDQIKEFFENIKKNSPEGKNLRDAIAPKEFRDYINNNKDLTTAEMVKARAEYDVRNMSSELTTFDEYQKVLNDKIEFWKDYLQLLKDASKGEGNLLLDFALDQFKAEVEEQEEGQNISVIDKQLELALKLAETSQNMEIHLGRIHLDERIPKELKKMWLNMVRYHFDVYSRDGGDYYGSNNVEVVANLRTIRGERNPADWRLYGEAREN
jgi:hypothetical protein